jgi:tetratricopeptide (TPR) repeat protein
MDNPATLYDRAFVAYRAGDKAAAEPLLDLCLAQAPDMARAYLLKSVVHDKADAPTCLALVEQAAMLDPSDAEAWYNLGVFQSERGRRDEALRAYQRAVDLSPFMVDALNNGCELLRRSGKFTTALGWADRQLAAHGPSWAAHLNRAICLVHLRRFAEAEAAFAEAKALAADRPIVDWERFSLMLFMRRFAEAWDDFEYRFACGHLNGVFCYPFVQPLWRGQPLAGKHILIHNEQGLGDQLMFASALDEVIAAAGKVTLVAAPELVPLFTASFPKARVLTARYGAFAGDHPPPDWLGTLGQVDFQAPIGSLMAVLRRTDESFAAPKAFIRPSDTARKTWAGFKAGPGLKVGVCWASNPAVFRSDSAQRAVRKSMPLEAMTPLTGVKGIALISVLNWTIDPMPAAFKGKLTDVSRRLRSLDDTAALIENLDLVVTVDTAVAHLAGAMGKETWLLLHDFADCRWELEADRSYWYPDMTLIRQDEAGDWPGVMAQVVERLNARVAAAS